MSEEQKQIVEMMKSREQDIEIMQLLLKHNLTKKRAEYKLLIMYYKACNVMSKAKLMMSRIDDNGIGVHHIPQIHNDIKQASLWYERLERRASNL
ncbi:MAG: hypothetical protein OEZ35_08155 [Candidatus Bathyarchaeota archaeon]|nr:hypothetical protein [Candidatus Bathyarchaeota archaeon]